MTEPQTRTDYTKEYYRQYYFADKEQIRQVQQEYYSIKENYERRKELARQYYNRNKQKIKDRRLRLREEKKRLKQEQMKAKEEIKIDIEGI